MFGTQFVGAIHGRLLTAWSTAGIVGPVIVNYLHDTRQAAGVAPDQIYGPIFYVLAGLLVGGFVANLLVRPVNPKWNMRDAEIAEDVQSMYRLARDIRLVRHRQRWLRRQGRALLAAGRHPAGVGRLEDGAEGGGVVHRLSRSVRLRRSLVTTISNGERRPVDALCGRRHVGRRYAPELLEYLVKS